MPNYNKNNQSLLKWSIIMNKHTSNSIRKSNQNKKLSKTFKGKSLSSTNKF